MKMTWEIEEGFATDPTARGWYQHGSDIIWDSVEEALSGDLKGNDSGWLKAIVMKTITDSFKAEFVIESTWTSPGARALIGFFNLVNLNTKSFLGITYKDDDLSCYVIYDDAHIPIIKAFFTMSKGTKYRIAMNYNSEDHTLYIEVYDFSTNLLLGSDTLVLDTAKSLSLDAVGVYQTVSTYTDDQTLLLSQFNALDEDAIDYGLMYCTSAEARLILNQDTSEITDEQLNQIQSVFVLSKIDSLFRAEGYVTPFDTGVDTPPIIRTLAAILVAAYASKRLYSGHSPNESPAYLAHLKDANEIFQQIKDGDIEVQEPDGSWIQRSQTTSTDVLSTTEDKYSLFTLDDAPDITKVMNGRDYIGRTSD